MTRKLEEQADLFQETDGVGGQIGGIETTIPEKHGEWAPRTALSARSKGTSQPQPDGVVSQGPTRNSIGNRMEALLLASQILEGLGAYTCKRSRKRNQFYRRDLNWIADVLLRVDAGERNPLRPWGE